MHDRVIQLSTSIAHCIMHSHAYFLGRGSKHHGNFLVHFIFSLKVILLVPCTDVWTTEPAPQLIWQRQRADAVLPILCFIRGRVRSSSVWRRKKFWDGLMQVRPRHSSTPYWVNWRHQARQNRPALAHHIFFLCPSPSLPIGVRSLLALLMIVEAVHIHTTTCMQRHVSHLYHTTLLCRHTWLCTRISRGQLCYHLCTDKLTLAEITAQKQQDHAVGPH